MRNKLLMAICLPLLLGMVSCSGNEGSTSSSSSSSGVKTGDFYVPISKDDGSGNYQAYKMGTLEYVVDERYGETEAFVDPLSTMQYIYSQGLWGELDVNKLNLEADTQLGYRISIPNKESIDIVIDTALDKINFSDYDGYRSLGSPYYNELCGAQDIAVLEVVSNECVRRSSYSFDLGEYGIDILQKGDSAYIPAAICSYIFSDPKELFFSFNGESFYFYNDSAKMFYGEDNGYTDFAKSYYGGPLNATSPSQEIATLHGNESMFYLDHFYGFPDRDELEGKKFSEFLKEKHKTTYDLFFSTGKEDSQKAWGEVARYLIGDGHTSSTNNLGSFYSGGIFNNQSPYSARDEARWAVGEEIANLRKTAWGQDEYSLTEEKMYEEHGDMAIIRFDVFRYSGEAKPNSNEEEYEAAMPRDLYSHFAYAFSRIKKNSAIKKIVIDLANNAGGEAKALFEALTFLKEGYSYTLYDPLTEAFTKTSYKGILPGNEPSSYFVGDYDLYVLQSGRSFSCGNLFPTICKNNGIAKIVGEKSAGGACVVNNLHTPDGQWIQISGLYRLCLGNDTNKESNDGGIEPDITLDRSKFADLDAIRAVLN